MRPHPSLRVRDRLRSHVRRWGAYWAVALALLAASQMLWQWQTWRVRDLLTSGDEVVQ